MRFRTSLSTAFRWQVLTPMVAAIGCTVAALSWLGINPKLEAYRRTIYWVLAVVFLLALILAFREGYPLYRRKMAKSRLTLFLEKGMEFTRDMSRPVSEKLDHDARDWANKVETDLTRYLGQSYALRFRVQGNKIVMDNMSRLQWWEIQGRVEKLEEFLRELGSSS